MSDYISELGKFMEKYEADDNEWWRNDSGTHRAMFDSMHEYALRLEAELAEVKKHHINEATCHDCPCRLNFVSLAIDRIAPLEGSFTGWTKCKGDIIVKLRIPAKAKLRIPAKAKRANAWTRKCQAEYVEVLEIINADEAVSSYDSETTYKVGKTVKCDNWDDDYSKECSGGIHFFMTREEAENY